jgi:chromosome segregation ATPase
VADQALELATTKAELAATKLGLAEALRQLAEMQKVEEYLRGRLHEKDKEIAQLKKEQEVDLKRKRLEIDRLRSRVQHLEEVCRRAGINGEPGCEDEEVQT